MLVQKYYMQHNTGHELNTHLAAEHGNLQLNIHVVWHKATHTHTLS